jgi:hypothetical protein
MMIWGDRLAAPLLGPGSTVWLLGYVLAKSGPFCASMRRDSLETAETGTICSNCAGSSKPGLLIWTVSITHDGRMIGFFWA